VKYTKLLSNISNMLQGLNNDLRLKGRIQFTISLEKVLITNYEVPERRCFWQWASVRSIWVLLLSHSLTPCPSPEERGDPSREALA
jgi:hypothetical protein